MSDFESVKLGVCDVFIMPKNQTVEINLGLTQGGIEFTYKPEWFDVKADQYGNTPIDSVLIGEQGSAKVPMLESTVKKMKMAMPTFTTKPGSTTDKPGSLHFGRKPGLRAQDRYMRLRLHPISMADTDYSEDIIIYRAVNKGEAKLGFTFNKERIIECTFDAFIDPTKKNGSMLFQIGSEGLSGTFLDLSTAAENSPEFTSTEDFGQEIIED